MSLSSATTRRTLTWAVAVAGACFVAALLVFGCHLRGTCTFTYDFVTGYHAINFYIIEHLRRGVFPIWIAPQSGGYPLYMQVQSDLFYFVPWVFSALDLTYTLRAANVVQVCHILFGAVGALFLGRRLGFVPAVSALCGVAYLFMGGFFDGSQHVDIIRGYAFYPWCLTALILVPRISLLGLLWRVSVLGLFYLSAYPGEVIASSYIWVVYVLAQAWCLRGSEPPGRLAWMVLLCAGMGAMGLSLAIPKYQPFFAEFAREVSRSDNFATVARARFSIESLFSFSLNCSSGDWKTHSTLRSHYVGLVILSMVLMNMSLSSRVKRVFFIVLSTAVFLSADLPLTLFGPLGKPFSLSRLTLADYKGYITLSVILLAAANLNALLLGKVYVSRRRALIVAVLLLAYQGGGLAYAGSRPALNDVLSVLFMARFLMAAAAASAAPPGLREESAQLSRTLGSVAVLACLLVVAEGLTLQLHNPLWRDRHVIGVARRALGFDLLDGTPAGGGLFMPLRERPARKDVGHIHAYSWRGLYTGQFILKGYDASKNLKKHEFLRGAKNEERIVERSGLISFFGLPGCALAFPNGTTPNQVAEFFRSASREFLEQRCKESPVKPRRYEATRVVYDVKLPQDMLVVENEISWTGWSGVLAKTDRATRHPLAEFSPYRTWLLPKGRYRFIETFENTHLLFSFQLAGGCLTLFILVTAVAALSLRRSAERSKAGEALPKACCAVQ